MSWEIRSVNHRYLDVSARLPEVFRSLEGSVRESVSKHLKRGKVDCHLSYRKDVKGAGQIELNEVRLNALLAASETIAKQIGQPVTSPLEVLKWPGVLVDVREDLEPVKEDAIRLLNEGLKRLIEAREREGEHINQMILSRCDQIDEQREIAASCLPNIQQQLRERLETKLAELVQQVDQSRLEQEVVILLNKSDVEEELDRLEAHIKEVKRILAQKGTIGRRLDFLMQELNREANTLGSKSVDLKTTNVSVEIKVLIEQMREQIQNIE